MIVEWSRTRGTAAIDALEAAAAGTRRIAPASF